MRSGAATRPSRGCTGSRSHLSCRPLEAASHSGSLRSLQHVDGRQLAGLGRGGAMLGSFGAFLQPPGPAPDSLPAALGQAFGMTLLGRARGASLARMGGALLAAALLGAELLGRRSGGSGRLAA